MHLSIIVPIYNRSNFLEPLFLCFENQTNADFEVIFVNDGSTDNSETLIKDWIKETDLEVSLINQSNCGVSTARNAGIRKSDSQYICFVDPDDLISDDYVQNYLTSIYQSNYDVVLHSINVRTTSGRIIQKGLHSGIYSGTHLISLLTSGKLDGFSFQGVFRKEFLINNNIYFNQSLKMMEDTLFLFQIFELSEHVRYINNASYYYIINEASGITNNMTDATWNDALNVSEYIFNKCSTTNAAKMWSLNLHYAIKSNDHFLAQRKEYLSIIQKIFSSQKVWYITSIYPLVKRTRLLMGRKLQNFPLLIL